MTSFALVKASPLEVLQRFDALPLRIAEPGPGIDVHSPAVGEITNNYRLCEVIEVEEPPSPLHHRVGEELHRSSNVLTITGVYEPPTLDEVKGAKRIAIDAKRDELMEGGFAYDFGGEHGVKVLQTRHERDRINWLTAKATYGDIVADGHGDAPGAEFRTEDNVVIGMTFAEAVAVLRAMGAWGARLMSVSWALKDAVTAAPDEATVEAIDVEGAPWLDGN